MKKSLKAVCVSVVVSLPAVVSAQATQAVLTPAQQISGAVQAAPAEMRDGAAVLGYNDAKKLVSLREGKNDMVCLADDPSAVEFHVACYHKGLEPFMARGRALRAEGVTGPQVDTVRFKEINSGTLKMPSTPSALYTLTATAPNSFDPATGKVTGARWLYVVYIPGATTASTGLTTKPAPGVPWIMYPGTPKAHIMFFTGM